MRTVRRPRRYLPSYLMFVLRPVLRYSDTRRAYVLRAVGRRTGPVLRVERRRGSRHFDGVERRQARLT